MADTSQTKTKNYKYLDRLALVEACRNSVRRGYNRRIDLTPQEEESFPDRLYPIVFAMPHEHIAGEPAEPHVRAIVGLCASGGTIQLDLDMDFFNALPEVEVTE